MRPYGIKVKGHKRKKPEEKYDRDEEVNEVEEEESEAKRVAVEKEADGEDKAGEKGKVEDELEGIPIAPSENKSKNSGVIFVLEKASLEVAKVGKVN